MESTQEKEYPSGKLLIGDVLERIKDVPDGTVDCVISSPPYWGLRDYGVTDQWGSEPTFQEYLARMQELMEEIKRVLKKTGTCWINLGDSYGSHRSNQEGIKIGYEKQQMDPIKGMEKSRIGIPERFYIQCIDNGWIARNHIVWAKSNAMPTSVKDRFQNKWESIFFFSKNKRYFFNLDAVREKPISDYKDFNRRVRDAKKYKDMGLGEFSPTLAKASEKEIAEYGNHQPKGRSNFGSGKDIEKNMIKAARKEANVPGQSTQGIHRNRDEGLPDWESGDRKWEKDMGQSTQSIAKNHSGNFDKETGELIGNPAGKNPGDVFNINPRPFSEAHFATFPPELPEKIIKCAVPNKVCKKCGKPVENIMEPTAEYAKLLGKSWHGHKDDQGKGMTQDRAQKPDATASYHKVGETDCGCNAGVEPGVVFDPFMGSGTVALVAINLNRKWLGIELNPEYAEIIDKRLKPKMSTTLDTFGGKC